MTAVEHAQLVGRRAELMAELFLQDLEPAFVTNARNSEIGCDYLVGFRNHEGGIDTYAVQVRATEQDAGRDIKLDIPAFRRLAKSNVPGLLLVIDVKHNQIFFSWPTDAAEPAPTQKTATLPLTRASDETKEQLRQRMNQTRPRRTARRTVSSNKSS